MTKKDLIKAVSERSGLPQKGVDWMMECLVKTIQDELGLSRKSKIPGLGTFKLAVRQQKNGINPRTGEKIVIPQKIVIKFKADKGLAE